MIFLFANFYDEDYKNLLASGLGLYLGFITF